MSVDENKASGMPVIRISMQTAVGDKRGLSFETYVAADAKAEFISAMLDKLNFCADRQNAFYELEGLRAQLVHETSMLKALEDNLVMIDDNANKQWLSSGKQGKPKRSPSEMQARTNCETNIKSRREMLERLKQDIAKREALVGDRNGVSNSARDS